MNTWPKPRLAIVTVLVLAGAESGAGDAIRQSAPAGYVDVHMHLIGRTPRGNRGAMPRGGRADLAGSYDAAAARLIAVMDRHGVGRALVMPPPQSAGQPGGYRFTELLAAVRKSSGRLVLAAGGGELSPILLATDPSKVSSGLRSTFQREAEEIAQSGARAFGEMTALHFSFHDSHPFLQVAPDHPLYLLLADIAARFDMAIDLHMEAAVEDQPLPIGLAGVSARNPAVIRATIPPFERLLAHNRNARIVWQHVGWDNTGHMTPDLLRRLLRAHANLFLAIKVVRVERERFRSGNNIVDGQLRILPDWLALVREHPDRFVVGADEFVGSAPQVVSGPPSFDDTWSVLEQLPPDLRARVGRDNPARVYALTREGAS